MRGFLSWVILTVLGVANLIPNGNFTNGLNGWNRLWSREPGTTQIFLDPTMGYSGHAAVRIEHQGQLDWSFHSKPNLNVQAGDLFEMAGWVKIEGAGQCSLGVVTYDALGKVHDWNYGGCFARAKPNWQYLHARFAIPSDIVAKIQLRFTGTGLPSVR